MLLLFVWFLLFKFPPARRGKQSLTVKQIGTFFFFCWFNYLKPSIKYKLFQRQWRLFRLNLLFVPLCQFFLNPRIGPGHYSVSDGSPHERNYNELSLLWVTEGWETRFASFIAKRERICHDIVVRPGCQLQDRKTDRDRTEVTQHNSIFSRTKRTHLYLLF